MDAWTYDLLGLAYGLIVGISLGLTGGGGSIFAVPLLIYGLDMPVGDSVGMSLASVGITAGFGATLGMKATEVDVRAGLDFAAADVAPAPAPAGACLGIKISAAQLLSQFALPMPSWAYGCGQESQAPASVPTHASSDPAADSVLAAMCASRIGGGGFIIVPALLYVTGMSIHRGVATSLHVIFLLALRRRDPRTGRPAVSHAGYRALHRGWLRRNVRGQRAARQAPGSRAAKRFSPPGCGSSPPTFLFATFPHSSNPDPPKA